MEKNDSHVVEDIEEPSKHAEHDLKLDKHGLPLLPQPTDNKDDPLNWPRWLKLSVALQVSWLSFLGPMSSAVANPAFVPIGKYFHIGTVQASYSLMVYILFAAVGPLLAVPIANRFGRRPVYLVGNLVAGVFNLVGGYSPSWTGVMVTRAILGIFAGTPPAIGAATICDLYFMNERGFFMGIFTFFLTNGPHTASLIGGFAAQNLGWRWCYIIPGYLQLGTFVINLVALPETLYPRHATSAPHFPRSFRDLLLFRATLPTRRIKLSDFVRPLYMGRYLTVLLPTIYYMTCFAYGSVLFAATGSVLYAKNYHFTVSQTGMIISIPLLIGCFIGEASTGWFIDWLVSRDARKHGGQRRPEARLDGLWLSLLVPIGCFIEGICIQHKTHWIGPAFGMGMANLGLQAVTTVVYAYTTDYYKPQSAEISCFINFVRSIFSAFCSLYAIRLAGRIELQFAWLTFACLCLATFLPVFALRWLGPRISSQPWQKAPDFHNDL